MENNAFIWNTIKVYNSNKEAIQEQRDMHNYQGSQSYLVEIESGVKQGYEMSSLLLLLVLDWIMTNSMEGNNTGIRWKSFTNKLEDLDCADDIALLSSMFNDTEDKITAIKEWVNINDGKTKTIKMTVNVDKPVNIDGKE